MWSVITYVRPNPKRRGTASYERYALYEVGITVREALNRGVGTGDIHWDLDHGFIKLEGE
jgi:hypothetical protein